MNTRVLVTDGEQRAAIAVTRSLGRAGHDVIVCAASARSLAGGSRFCRREVLVASALTSPVQFVDDIARLVREWNVRIVVPVTDAALEALLPARDRLDGAIIPFADVRSYAGLSDKLAVTAVARELGIAVPEQRTVERREELEPAAKSLRYPLVLKPSRSLRSQNGQLAKLGVSHALDPEQLSERARTLDEAEFPLLLQERIEGPGMGILLLSWKGETLALFSHQRIREKPPAGGESVYSMSVAADKTLVQRCEALLRHFCWHGALMVEFKIDQRTGVPHLMEVNARFWGTLQLAIDAGVDFPRLLVDAALGGSPTPVREWRRGVRLRWWWGDVDNLITRLIRSPRRLALPPGAPGRLAAIRDFLATTLRGESDSVFRLDDPKPFVRETVRWLSRR